MRRLRPAPTSVTSPSGLTSTRQPLLDLDPKPGRLALRDGHGPRVRDLDDSPHFPYARDLANETNGVGVEHHVSKHARQPDLARRGGLERHCPAIRRAHAKEASVLELLLGLGLDARDLLHRERNRPRRRLGGPARRRVDLYLGETGGRGDGW